MMEKTVLFVDDESQILQGIHRMLRPMRRKWKMLFADRPEKALELLEQQPVDVVISDMRMPGMDGVAFLSEVRRRHPETARIILSGQSDEKLILKSVKIAHQYLAKPCGSDELKATVAKACALRDLLNNPSLQKTIAAIDSLPTLPPIYNRIVTELQAEDPSMQRIGEIIGSDPAMTAKILQLVNSAFFGLRRQISNPAQAVNYLGLNTVKALVLAVEIFSRFQDIPAREFSLDQLWHHCVRVADFAKAIAVQEGADATLVEDAYLAGLLHDTGKLILIANHRDPYRQVIRSASRDHEPCWEAEWAVFGTSHAEIGAYLMGLWGLPDQVIEAIAFHHYPSQFPGTEFHALAAVHGANILAHVADDHSPTAMEWFDSDYLERLSLTDHIDSWRETCQQPEDN